MSFPSAWGRCSEKKNHKGTRYSLRALPWGGFWRWKGRSPESQQAEAAHTVQEQPAPETEALSVQPTGVPLNEAPVWQRALVMVAGAVMNFVLGFVV